ncbi:MAG: aminotransferase class I/II-fold pyridoxal phosphate-dependent enzyme [Chitinophagaceae bacterium]|nr:aminotransferase class I/II-fold pyridoxal phosphate-dependent enzyme [Chitinophagaceae bacterium]
MALKVLNIGVGDEVIIPALSYIATANVVELAGATPIFVDIDAATYNIDVSKIEEKITSSTKAIIPVHEFGLACNIEKVCAIAEKHNLFVIEDAACALGALQKWKSSRLIRMYGFFFHCIPVNLLHPAKAVY